MTEVGQTDLSRLLQQKRNECNAIVTSRKRKLRELFAVATHVGDLADHGFANLDSQSATPAEWQFQQASDILQGKILNEQNIPQRPQLSLEVLKKSLASLKDVANRRAPQKSAPGLNQEPALVVKRVQQPPDAATTTISNVANVVKATPTPANSIPAKSTQPPTPQSIKPSLPAHQPTSNSSNSVAKSPPIAPTSSASKVPTSNNVDLSTVPPASQTVTRPVQPTPPTKAQPSPSDQALTTTGGSANGTIDTPAKDLKNLPAERNDVPPAKTSHDATRGPDAASSPGSTAQSAATPAIHDASTDTSPDNEGLQYHDANEVKSESEHESVSDTQAGVSESTESTDRKNQMENLIPESAEDQLLQESIRSTTTSSTPKPKEPAAVPSSKDIKTPALDSTADVVSTQKEEHTEEAVPSLEESTPQPGTTSTPNGAQMEIPDSQEEARDSMDVDVPSASAEPTKTQKQEVPVPQEQALPTPVVQTSPTPGPLTHKETSQAPERAVTRVSSGAMRLKSVNEIVGGTSRASSDRSLATKASQSQLTPVTSTPQSPASRHRHPSSHRRDRSKGQVSTVVFGKQPKRVSDKSIVASHKDTFQPSDDYFTPLFLQGFTASSNLMQPIEKILFHANKTVATPDTNLAIQDHQACKVLRRVYQLQQYEKWSLRQIKRCPEPTRPPSQWDVVLQEMKWMRTDFREERKWKAAVAKNLAHACAYWHEASPEERKALQVPAYIPPKTEPLDDVTMVDADEEGVDYHPTPDLVSSGDMDSPQVVDELVEEFPETVPPSAIFTLQEDDVIFGLRRTAASDQLLDELPIYSTPLKVPRFDLTGPEYDPDGHWRRPALPLSKYVEGQMKVMSDGPPRKRSRFDYQNEDSEDEDDGGFVNYDGSDEVKLPPSTDEVALFNPESKSIRDRLHAGHQFRPPSEHPMPTQSFYECRSPSQWVMAEDDELRGLVRDYSYNWSLISSMLTTKSLFTSGAERRTPWECFERWINLEGLPADMQKTQYFKAYNSRIEAAQRVIAQQNQLAAQQASASGGTMTPVRRRQSTPLRVERRRNQKHLTLIDAMRKLAKKRETTIQKQQHTASQSVANKKTNDAMSQRPTKTPRDYSLLRWERDQALAEKMAQYAQRQEAQRRAAMQARAQGQQAAQMAGTPGVPQAAPAANHPAGNNAVNGVNRANIPNQLAAAAAAAAAAGQGRPRMPMQAPANGMAASIPAQMGSGLMPPAQMNGVPQAQMQGLQGQPRMQMPPQQTDANLMLRAQRISEQQRAAVQIKQAQQHHQQQQPGNSATPVPVPQQASPPLRNGLNGINQQSFMNNAQAIMASFNANGNGHSTPPAGGLHMPSVPNGASPGPRVQPQIPASITAQLQQLETTFRAKNPSMTPEQARQLATEHLTRAMMAQRQSAMNAAAGGSGQPGLANSIAATTSPHQYAALLRQQQQQQAQQQAQQQQRQATPAAGSPAQAQQHQQHQQQPQQQHQQQHQHQQQQQQQHQHQQQQLQQQQQQQQQQQLQQQRQASGSATPSLPPSAPTPTPAAATPAPPATPVAK